MRTIARLTLIFLGLTSVASAQEATDPGSPGPHAVATKKIFVDLTKNKGPLQVGPRVMPVTVFHPEGKKALPLVLIVHGFLSWGGDGQDKVFDGTNEYLVLPSRPHLGQVGTHTQLARHLASRGFAVAHYWAPNVLEFEFAKWRANAKATLDALEAENKKAGGPLEGLFAAKGGTLEKVGLVGHSYGGATSIALSGDSRVKATVALAPGVASPSMAAGLLAGFVPLPLRQAIEKHMSKNPLPGEAKKYLEEHASAPRDPVLVIEAELDRIVQDQGQRAFERIGTKKLYLEMKGGVHSNFAEFRTFAKQSELSDVEWLRAIEGDEQRAIARRYATAWLEEHILDTPRPEITTGEEAKTDPAFLKVDFSPADGLEAPKNKKGIVQGLEQQKKR